MKAERAHDSGTSRLSGTSRRYRFRGVRPEARRLGAWDYHKAAKKLGAKLGTPAGATGPVEAEMNTYNSGRVSGLAVGAFGEVSSQIRDLADLVACELSAEYLAFFDIAKKQSKGIFTQR